MDFEKKFTPLEKSRMRLDVKVAQKDAAEFYQDILQKYAKTLLVPGFRKGKVPLNVLENKYGPDLRQEAKSGLVNQVMEKVVEQADRYEAPLVYSQPVLDGSPEFNPEKDFSFAVEYDVFPKTDLKNLEGFEIEVPDVSVDEEDIQKELETVRKRNALIIDKEDDACAESGDIATLTYAEIDEDGNEVEDRKWESRIITLGEDSDIYGIDEVVLGMKKGETKETEKAFPDDYKYNLLAGKTIKLKVTVDALKKAELPALDDELAQDVSEKYKTLDDLKNDIRKSMELSLEDRLTSTRNSALIEKIIEANDFELPESMIGTELEARWQNLAIRFNANSSNLEKIMAGTDLNKPKLFADWRPSAEKQLKSRIVVETLIEQMGIDAAEEDAEKEMEKIAEKSGVSIDEVKKHYADSREKEYLIDDIKEQRLYDRLLEKCSVKKGKKQTLDEFFSGK